MGTTSFYNLGTMYRTESIDSDEEDKDLMTEKKASLRFGIGIILMICSFLVYFVYPFIPFLSYSNNFKVLLAFIVWGVAWAIFAVGIACAGKEGYQKIKDFTKKLLKTKRTK